MTDRKDLLLGDEEDYDDYRDRYQGNRKDRAVPTRLMAGLFIVCAVFLLVPFILYVFGVISRGIMTICFLPSILITAGILIANRR